MPPAQSESFAPSVSSLMINYKVDGLDALLANLAWEPAEER